MILKVIQLTLPAALRLFLDNGIILISVMTYELIKEFFDCEYFGKLPVKYKGDLQMYEVKGHKTGIFENGDGQTPNAAFRIKFGLDTVY